MVDAFVNRGRSAGNAFSRFLKNIVTIGKQRFTVMFIPHSEKKIFNFRISVFSLIFLSILLTCILIAFFLSSTTFSGLSRLLDKKSKSLERTEASLEVMKDEISELKNAALGFESTLSKTLATLGIDSTMQGNLYSSGDLSSFIGVEEQSEGVLKELSELRNIHTLLNDSVGSLQKITDLLVSHGALLKELPTLWPVYGGVGRITTLFGPAEHPFTKVWYLHKGLDISYQAGQPILATADGKVVENKYDIGGYGNYLVIRHKYGFYTQYAHLQDVYVKEGDIIVQGQRIGSMGSTGLSTGPHLHYEVRIGSQVVDPQRYLSISSGLKKTTIRN